jgi:hypothetical protein
MAKQTITNISDGPRGFYSGGALIMLEKGESVEAEADAGTFETGYFEGSDGEGGLDSLTVADLKALAEAEEIDLGDATKKADIIAAIELAREAAGQA